MSSNNENIRYSVHRKNGRFLGQYGVYDLWVFPCSRYEQSFEARYGSKAFEVITESDSFTEPLEVAERFFRLRGLRREVPVQEKNKRI